VADEFGRLKTRRQSFSGCALHGLAWYKTKEMVRLSWRMVTVVCVAAICKLMFATRRRERTRGGAELFKGGRGGGPKNRKEVLYMYEKEEVVYIFVETVVARFIGESKWIEKHTRRLEIWRIRYSIRYISGQGRAASRKTVAAGAHRWRTKCSRMYTQSNNSVVLLWYQTFKRFFYAKKKKTKQKSSPTGPA
jgi:hypothetical protein